MQVVMPRMAGIGASRAPRLSRHRIVVTVVGVEIAFADVGGWDTHVNQGASTGQLAARLTDFSSSVSALVTDLGDRMQDVVILSMSEFGRMVRQNGNGGTDHGHAGAMFVIGGGVKGGKVLGAWPGLAREQLYEGRDLALTTDFRAVFSEILAAHGAPPTCRACFPATSHGPSGCSEAGQPFRPQIGVATRPRSRSPACSMRAATPAAPAGSAKGYRWCP